MNKLKIIQMSKVWHMPNSNTFKIKPIKELIRKHLSNNDIVLDPFANEHSIKSIMNDVEYITNDLNPAYNCDYSLEAQQFLKQFKNQSVDLILYDPVYSPRQVSECYKKLGRTVTIEDTKSSYWTKFKKEISKKIKIGGKVISFGWNSNGIGKNNGFKIIEILLVSHGGNHNDTICVVEEKTHHQETLFSEKGD